MTREIDAKTDRSWFRKDKTKAARRRIPLTERAVNVLRPRIKGAPTDFLFFGGRGGKSKTLSIVKLNNAHYGVSENKKISDLLLKIYLSFKNGNGRR